MPQDQTPKVREIDDALGDCRQGDVVDFRTLSWQADTRRPLTPVSAEATEPPGHSIVVSEVAEMAVLTQTCDIVRSCADRPFLQLAPVVSLPADVAAQASRGMRPRYAPLPGMGDAAFADLDRVLTVEKSLVATAPRRRGCSDAEQSRRFASSIARKFGRIAFPDSLAASLEGLVRRIRSKHGRDSQEGRALVALEEIRVTGSPSWTHDEIDVFLAFCPASADEARRVMPDTDWDALIDDWVNRCIPTGPIASVDGAMIPLDEMTALEYLDSDLLDLDHLSA